MSVPAGSDRDPFSNRASLVSMEDRSEEQIVSRLLELENGEQAERRVRLRGERYLSLLQDPDNGLSYVLRHGTDETEGAEIPKGTEFYEYSTIDVARRAFNQLLGEARRAGTLVEEGSPHDPRDFQGSGAGIRAPLPDPEADRVH